MPTAALSRLMWVQCACYCLSDCSRSLASRWSTGCLLAVFVQHKSDLIGGGRNTSDAIMQSTARMATVSPVWSADDLPVVVFDCPDISLLGTYAAQGQSLYCYATHLTAVRPRDFAVGAGGFCESPKVLHTQSGATARQHRERDRDPQRVTERETWTDRERHRETQSHGVASTGEGGNDPGQLRVGFAESVVLRFSSVPEGLSLSPSPRAPSFPLPPSLSLSLCACALSSLSLVNPWPCAPRPCPQATTAPHPQRRQWLTRSNGWWGRVA